MLKKSQEKLPIKVINRTTSKKSRAITFANTLHIYNEIYINSKIPNDKIEIIKNQVDSFTGENNMHDDIVDNILDSIL